MNDNFDSISNNIKSYKEKVVKKNILDKREKILNKGGKVDKLDSIRQFRVVKKKEVKFADSHSEFSEVSSPTPRELRRTDS